MKFTPALHILTWILGLLPVLVLTQNCGAQRFDTVPVAGNTVIGSTEEPPVDTAKPTTICSADIANRADLKIRTGVVYNSLGQVDTTKIRLKLMNVPQAMIDEKWDMVVYDWGADSSGNQTDFAKRGYRFERKVGSGFQIISENVYTKVNIEEIVAMGSHLSMDLTARQALEYFSFQVDLGSGTRQVLNVTFYKADGTKVADQEIDVLMPVFYANPDDYAVGKPTILKNLHPLKERAGQTWTFAQWKEFFQNMCF